MNKDFQTIKMNTFHKFFISFAVFSTVLFSSCELYNPAEPTPAYIHIQNFTLTTNALQGSNSHKITDAWVYVDDQIIGCFELPVTFPVISEGSHKVKIVPGIKVNGIAANRAQYPFYTSFEQVVDFQVGKTITLSPNVTYKSSATFEFMCDFETVGLTIDTTNYSDSALQILSLPDPNVFEGSKSAIGYTDPTRFRFECATIDAFELPKGGSPVFLEFNYKCNFVLVVSVIAQGTSSIQQFPALYLNPTNGWNKAYVYLTPTVSGAFSADDYKIVWGMSNTIGQDSAAILLDNIKLIH